MSKTRRDDSPDCYVKKWPSVFSQDRVFNDDRIYGPDRKFANVKRNIDAVGDDVGFFWQDSQVLEDLRPFSKFEEVKKFCQGARLEDLKSGAITETQRRAAWTDDRCLRDSGCLYRDCADLGCSHWTTRKYRKYSNPLTATGLCRLLEEPRFGHAHEPDADRRLIYIANLDPYYILALVETASQHQISVLKEAIWKHLKLKTSIAVKIPTRGYTTFELQLHLPYFALRTSPPREDLAGNRVNSRPSRRWTGLSFLKISTPESQEQIQYGLYEAQFSLVICGSGDRRWVAYAFDDTDFDGENFGEELREDLGEEAFTYDGINVDPIASDDIVGIIDANDPIENPREYYLKVFEFRIAQVLEEWERVVSAVESGAKRYRKYHPSTLSRDSGNDTGREEDLKETYYCTVQTLELLHHLLDVLSKATKAWERFNSRNGDRGYFAMNSLSSCSQHPSRLSLFEINQKFDELKHLQQDLFRLEKSCQNSAQALKLLLVLESNEATKHNGLTTELTVSVISPFALVTAYFSMPQAVIPFKLNFKSFIISLFVIMAVVRLLFTLLGALLKRSWLWRKALAWKKAVQLEDMSQCFPMRRGRDFLDGPIGELEMDTLEV